MNSVSTDPGRLQVVVGGQFGSEGKGHLTAQLASRADSESVVIRTGGPNAGHTVWARGNEFKLRQLPTPVAIRDDIFVCLGRKSVINPEILRAELELFPDRIVFVDPAATILEPWDIEAEESDSQMGQIGSTRKGIGCARARRIFRTARTAFDLWGDEGSELDPRIICVSVAGLAYSTLSRGRDVIVEGAQGYGLGLHTGYYPYTTSADCTALDVLAEVGISPWAVGIEPQIWMAVRPYPIRVAGTSGPLAAETSWEELGLPPEWTTVTKKIRRVGYWDPELIAEAVQANGGGSGPWGRVKIALMMADQVVPALRGIADISTVVRMLKDPDQSRLADLVSMVADDAGAGVGALGTGPQTMVFAEDAGVSGL